MAPILNKLYVFLQFLAIVSSCLIAGCEQLGSLDRDELAVFLAKPENGLIKRKSYDQVGWKAQIVPPEIEKFESGKGQKFSNILQFLLTVEPGKVYQHSDVMISGVESYDDYSDRMMKLNFNIADMIELRFGGSSYRPVLTNMENTFGLSNDRKIHVVFADPDFPDQLALCTKIDLVLEDRVFETGISHFIFEESFLRKVPNQKD